MIDSGATYSEISPTPRLVDKRSTYKMLETLESVQLIKPAFLRGGEQAYSITPAGQYRLQQLEEQLEFQCKAYAEAEKQKQTDKRRFIFNAVIGILTLVVGIVAAVGAVLALVPR